METVRREGGGIDRKSHEEGRSAAGPHFLGDEADRPSHTRTCGTPGLFVLGAKCRPCSDRVAGSPNCDILTVAMSRRKNVVHVKHVRLVQGSVSYGFIHWDTLWHRPSPLQNMCKLALEMKQLIATYFHPFLSPRYPSTIVAACFRGVREVPFLSFQDAQDVAGPPIPLPLAGSHPCGCYVSINRKLASGRAEGEILAGSDVLIERQRHAPRYS